MNRHPRLVISTAQQTVPAKAIAEPLLTAVTARESVVGWVPSSLPRHAYDYQSRATRLLTLKTLQAHSLGMAAIAFFLLLPVLQFLSEPESR
jgi:hypothetical protein